MADADNTLALTEYDDSHEDRGMAQARLACIQRSYLDLRRRSGPLIMSDCDQISFQHKMDRVRARLKFFGLTV